MRGSRDICYIDNTRFSHRTRDDVFSPGSLLGADRADDVVTAHRAIVHLPPRCGSAATGAYWSHYGGQAHQGRGGICACRVPDCAAVGASTNCKHIS